MTHSLSNYSIEQHLLLNMEKNKLYYVLGDSPKIFTIESELSLEEKIDFIDNYAHLIDSKYKNFATSMINLINKWGKDKLTLPQDSSGRVKTVSKKAWIKRNDSLGVVDFEYKIGTYYFASTWHKSLSLNCDATEYGYNMTYTNSHIVNQWFHDLLNRLSLKEHEHFKSVDPVSIKFDKVYHLARIYPSFDVPFLHDIVWNTSKVDKSSLTEEILDTFLECFGEIAAFQENLKNKVMEKYPTL